MLPYLIKGLLDTASSEIGSPPSVCFCLHSPLNRNVHESGQKKGLLKFSSTDPDMV